MQPPVSPYGRMATKEARVAPETFVERALDLSWANPEEVALPVRAQADGKAFPDPPRDLRSLRALAEERKLKRPICVSLETPPEELHAHLRAEESPEVDEVPRRLPVAEGRDVLDPHP